MATIPLIGPPIAGIISLPEPRVADNEPLLVKRIIELATEYGRYGYRRVPALLRKEGRRVNHKRVERI